MLTHLTLQNFLLAQKLSLAFGPGFSVITGPSGSGKSTLFKALTVVLGEKAQGAWVGPHGAEAQVSASFMTSSPIHTFLQEHDVPAEAGEDLLMRRVWSADGRSRAYVNDIPVSQKLLRALGGQLLDVHGQFDRLLDAEQHRDLLDRYGGHSALRAAVATAFEELQTARKNVDAAQHALASKGERQAFLDYALEELITLAPMQGEETKLAQEKQFLLSGAHVASKLQELEALLSGDEAGLMRAMHQAQKALAPLGEGGGEFAELGETIDGATEGLYELVRRLQGVAHRFETPERSLEEVDSRLYALRQAARRHQVTVDELEDVMHSLLAEKEQLEGGEGHIAALEAALTKALAAYHAEAALLRAARQASAGRLDASVQEMLLSLHLPRARFQTSIAPVEDGTKAGADTIVFHVALNAGATFTPLSETASGGEQARIILALRAILAAEMGRTTVVFDEADSGMGGAVAASVGQRLAELGRQGQVIAITHSPQVAAYAGQHFVMEKHQEAEHAYIGVAAVEGDVRRDELARMLAGATLSETARAAAATLLAEASTEGQGR